MAAIACPTWAEVLAFPPEELQAFNIVKGELNGDEFLWDQPHFDRKAQKMTKGVWKSVMEKEAQEPGRAERVR
jgi:hypothetical protein